MQFHCLTSGCYNIFFGTCAASACTPTGNFNVVIGGCAGYCSTGAACNILLGRDAYRKNETGSNNVVLGNRAGCSNLCSNNVFLGNGAGTYGSCSMDSVYIEISPDTILAGDKLLQLDTEQVMVVE